MKQFLALDKVTLILLLLFVLDKTETKTAIFVFTLINTCLQLVGEMEKWFNKTCIHQSENKNCCVFFMNDTMVWFDNLNSVSLRKVPVVGPMGVLLLMKLPFTAQNFSGLTEKKEKLNNCGFWLPWSTPGLEKNTVPFAFKYITQLEWLKAEQTQRMTKSYRNMQTF